MTKFSRKKIVVSGRTRNISRYDYVNATLI